MKKAQLQFLRYHVDLQNYFHKVLIMNFDITNNFQNLN